jgi:hypothetical protein
MSCDKSRKLIRGFILVSKEEKFDIILKKWSNIELRMLYFMLGWEFLIVMTRETREGWPLLTVETGVNVDSKRTNERDPSLDGSLGL